MTQNTRSKYIKGKPDWLTVQLIACLIIAALFIPAGLFLESAYSLNILIMTLIFAVMGIGWVVGSGLTGLLLIGYISFFGVGAYTCALLFTKFGVSPWIGMPLAGAGGTRMRVEMSTGKSSKAITMDTTPPIIDVTSRPSWQNV